MSNCCKKNEDKCCGIGFHSIPAALGDDTGEFKPENGAYHNMLVKYEENGVLYLYSNDGIYTKVGEPIGDATLTIKQGDTVLGTFSANASENVEIDVSDSHTQTLSVTLQYDGSDIREWDIRGQGLIFRIENGSAAGWVEDREVPEGFSFINDATSSPISVDDIFTALNAGEDVVFNGLPIGAYLDTSEEEIYYVPVNGVRISSSQTIIEEGTDVVIYTGTTLVEMPEGAMVPVGFKLGKYTYTMPEESTSYSLIVQCINGTQLA